MCIDLETEGQVWKIVGIENLLVETSVVVNIVKGNMSKVVL